MKKKSKKKKRRSKETSKDDKAVNTEVLLLKDEFLTLKNSFNMFILKVLSK